MSAPVYSMTLLEQYKLIVDTSNTCKSYLISCKVSIYKSNEANAYVDSKNNLKLSSRLMSDFSYNEVKAVTYHEIAHLILGHPQLFSGNKITNKELLIKTRHISELEADRLASHLMILDNVDNELDIVLTKLKPKYLHNKNSNSHPSVTERVKRIKEYKQCTK